jgi:hypothetical protein
VGEVLYEEILSRYPLRFCASVIAGEAEYYASEFSREIAKAVFALPNVDAASHSWTHPHDWNLCVDLEREIVESTTFINEELLSGEKRVDTFLWTGLCNPTAEALALTQRLGISNMNGGSPDVPWQWKDGYPHFHSRAPNDWYFMNLDRLMKLPENTSVYHAIKSHPGDLGKFDRVIQFWKENPRYPIHVYFHWYSAVRKDSLLALHKVLTWVSERGFESVSVHDYIESVRPDRAMGAVNWSG